MGDRFGIFGTVIRIRKLSLSLLLVMMLRIPNSIHSSASSHVSHISAEMADPREHEEEMMNLICGPTEEVYHDDREADENPEDIDDCSQYLVDPNEQDNAG